MAYFATDYTIHFDDTMAYGSHHFLTAFKFQCAAREAFLFGERIYDIEAVRLALDDIHLITADAYSRNLSPAHLGERVAILLTLEEWGRASARFCYRVMGVDGRPVCAGFQTLICVDAKTGLPIPLPTPLQQAMDAMHEIEEPAALESFRDRVLAGGGKIESLFGQTERETAVHFLSQRYPSPGVIAPCTPQLESPEPPAPAAIQAPVVPPPLAVETSRPRTVEAWVFAGQGVFDAALLSQRVVDFMQHQRGGREQLQQAMAIARQCLAGDVDGVISGNAEQCQRSVQETEGLSQVAIHLQNVLGAALRQVAGQQAAILMGHSFGEIAALCVGGQYDLATGVRIVCERVRAITQYRPTEGGLLVVAANRQCVGTEAALLGLARVAIAGRNHDRQTVVSGPQSQLAALRESLQHQSISSMPIASPTSFHHPDLEMAAATWRGQLQTLPLTAPVIPVYSCIGRRFLAQDDELAAVLASHLLRPFDLQGGILDVVAAGVNTFVDCGSVGGLAKILTQATPAGTTVCVAGSIQEQRGERVSADATTRATGQATGASMPVARRAPMEDLATANPGQDTARVPQAIGSEELQSEDPRVAAEQGASHDKSNRLEALEANRPKLWSGGENQGENEGAGATDRSRVLPSARNAEWLRANPVSPEGSGQDSAADPLETRREQKQVTPGDDRATQPAAVHQNPVVRPTIAIVGQGCILPGGATSPAQLFAAINEQRSGIVDQRQFDEHWAEDFYSAELVADRTNSPFVGRVNDGDIQVPQGVDPEVFEHFSRTQRLLGFALAPCLPSLVRAKRVLCLIGATADGFENQDWSSSLRYAGIDPLDPAIADRLLQAQSEANGLPTSGVEVQSPHNAIQQVFDRMVRPGLEVTMIDAACASSLYAVALGMRALEQGTADVVVAGGVFCPGPGNSCLFSQFRGLTSTGCRPFDAGADGVVFSEGAALVALSRMTDAEERDLPVAAIVRGAGLSSDGRSSSANVPQSEGQLLSLERCYADYGIDPATILAIEGHGTSTPVGDSTEVETLRRFFSQVTAASPRSAIPLHSLKGLLGHAGWAAGTASMIAAAEYLRQGRFPAQAGHQQPSAALAKAAETLVVPTRPQQLPTGQRRIAIDGFGFGGANAHVVLESPAGHSGSLRQSESLEPANVPIPGDSELGSESAGNSVEDPVSQKLVLVACHEQVPSLVIDGYRQFDRPATTVPPPHVLLPDLADDMDISQTLAISLVDAVAEQLADFSEAWAGETAVVLAQRGKTDRGVEATLRVLADRLRRHLSGVGEAVATLDAAVSETRSSGPYTLQCMMPNVSAGRAALMQDLHGPNFVVDAGENSLEAAMQSAELLLAGGEHCGTKLVLVAAIHANIEQVARPLRQQGEDELAAIFGVTTAGYAKTLGVEVIGELDELMSAVDGDGAIRGGGTMTRKVRSLLDTVATPRAVTPAAVSSDTETASTETEFPLYVPRWTEVPRELSRAYKRSDSLVTLVLTTAESDCLAELVDVLPHFTRRFTVVVVGAEAQQEVDGIDHHQVIPWDPSGADAMQTLLDRIPDFDPDVVVSMAQVSNWDFQDALTKVASDNSLCEALFLVSQQFVDKLQQGNLELWGLYQNGWDGRLHPESGAVAGMLKAIQREFPETRAGVICTRDATTHALFEQLAEERSQSRHETEIVYDRGQRLVRRLCLAAKNTPAQPLLPLSSDSVVVATGGARGVTAVLIESLLRDYQCNVIAIGRSKLEAGPQLSSDDEAERDFYDRYARENPEATPVEMRSSYQKVRACWEAHATIERLSSLGGRIKYVTADVTKRDEVDRVVGEIAKEFGPVDLLLHGAGVQYSKRLEHRKLKEFRQTFGVKLGGLRNLVDACREQWGTLVNAHVLTSAYSVFGNDGQHDYGAANETLDRLCSLGDASHDCSWSSIAWLAWDGVGMTRGSEYRALARQRELSGLTPEDGQYLFRQVMAGCTRSAINVPMSRLEHVNYEVKTVPCSIRDLESRGLEDSACDGRVVEVPVELSTIACLPFHRVRQTPTLPGAWILDRMVQAALELRSEEAEGVDTVTIERVFFKRFVRYTGNQEPQMRVIAEETGHGIAVWMVGDLYHPSGAAIAKGHVFAHATLDFAKDPLAFTSALPDRVLVATADGFSVNDPYCNGCHQDVQLSGPFDCIRDMVISPRGRHARIESDPTCEWPTSIPSLLLDAAWRVGAMYANPTQEDLYVPLQIGRLVLPVGQDTRLQRASALEIRTTSPIVANGNARWERTEVVNENGEVQLCVENTLATRLR